MTSQGFRKLGMPSQPGVYFFKKGKTILYIGKATNLRERVRSYFARDLIDTRGPGILDMVTSATTIDWQVTPSVLEALVLEANLIKQHQPKYNVKEKDNKSFNCVAITADVWPRVIIIREREAKMKKFKYVFGPFPSGKLLKIALGIIRKVFPFLDDKNYQEFYKQLQLVPGGARDNYLKTIKNIKLFFEGKKSRIITLLQKDMDQAAKNLEFERAGILKRQITALNHLNDVALLRQDEDTPKDSVRIESYDIAHLSGKNTVGVMTVVTNGHVDKSEYRKFKIKSGKGNDDPRNLQEIIDRRFAHTEWSLPDFVVIDGNPRSFKIPVPAVYVIKNDKHKPVKFMGDEKIIKKYKKEILLANSESHRFAISFHKQLRDKSFLG